MGATTQFVTFTVADLLLGLPVRDVQEVLGVMPVTPVPCTGAAVAGLMNLRGQVVTVLALRARFGLADSSPGVPGGNVLVRTAGGPVAFTVDHVGDVIDVPQDAFEAAPATLTGPGRSLIVGAYKLPAGLLLHLDLPAALSTEPALGRSTRSGT